MLYGMRFIILSKPSISSVVPGNIQQKIYHWGLKTFQLGETGKANTAGEYKYHYTMYVFW